MRKLLLLPVFLLLALALATGPAQASILPPATSLVPVGEDAEEFEDETSEPEDEAEEAPGECTIEDEEDVQLCAEIAQEEREEAEAERCVLADATASVAANPGSGTVRLTIRYRAFTPASVAIDARLRGAKGGLHLGSSHARFRRSGVFHDSFGLSKKEMAKALAAREFAIDLRAVNTPSSCALHLTTHRGAARKLLWS
jgi:hypothetical protein